MALASSLGLLVIAACGGSPAVHQDVAGGGASQPQPTPASPAPRGQPSDDASSLLGRLFTGTMSGVSAADTGEIRILLGGSVTDGRIDVVTTFKALSGRVATSRGSYVVADRYFTATGFAGVPSTLAGFLDLERGQLYGEYDSDATTFLALFTTIQDDTSVQVYCGAWVYGAGTPGATSGSWDLAMRQDGAVIGAYVMSPGAPFHEGIVAGTVSGGAVQLDFIDTDGMTTGTATGAYVSRTAEMNGTALTDAGASASWTVSRGGCAPP